MTFLARSALYSTCAIITLVNWSPSAVGLQQQGADRVTTLYSNDDLLHSWSFSLGETGSVCRNGQIYNRNSQLVFDRYGAEFASGVEGGSKARILNIGDLKVKGYPGSVYHSLTRKGNVIIVKDTVGKNGGATAEQRFELAAGEKQAKSSIIVGHVYLLLIDEGGTDSHTKFIAFRVLDHEPKRRVTFRWRLL